MKQTDFIKGKRALVVGGTGGIGHAIAEMLEERGAHVLVTGRKSGDIKIDFEKEQFCELTKKSEWKELEKEVKNADILCVCFGPFVQKSLEETTLQDWQKVALLDYALPGYLSSIALSEMKKRNFGRIILFGGTRTDQIRAFRTNAAYAGAKTAIAVLTKSLSAEGSPFSISANAILPGFVDTEYLSEQTKEALKAKMPDKKLIMKKEIANAAEFLIDSESANGVLLCVDKGWNA